MAMVTIVVATSYAAIINFVVNSSPFGQEKKF